MAGRPSRAASTGGGCKPAAIFLPRPGMEDAAAGSLRTPGCGDTWLAARARLRPWAMALCSEAALGPNAVPRPRARRTAARARAWARTGAGSTPRRRVVLVAHTVIQLLPKDVGPEPRACTSEELGLFVPANYERGAADSEFAGHGSGRARAGLASELGQASRAMPGRRTPGGAGTTADVGRGRAALSLARPGRRPDSRRLQTKRGAPGRGREATTAGRAGGREPGSCAGAVGARNGLPATANLDGTRPVRVGPRASESGRARARGQLSRAPDRITRLGSLTELGAPDAGAPLGRGRPGGLDSGWLGRRTDGQR